MKIGKLKGLKKVFVAIFPFLLGAYAKKNPKIADEAGLAIQVIEAQYGTAWSRDGFLEKFEAEMVARGATPETIALSTYYAKKHLEKLGVK